MADHFKKFIGTFKEFNGTIGRGILGNGLYERIYPSGFELELKQQKEKRRFKRSLTSFLIVILIGVTLMYLQSIFVKKGNHENKPVKQESL